ncbi:MAG TPA: transposase [Ktedonobacteraceae bacterium]|nr:transposase [Ktedonobacteraceae bacterium]
MNFNTLKQIRKLTYDSFERGADALFNLCDALLCEDQARSLPELSQSPFFERAWPSLYQALSNGRINEERLREIWIKALLSEVPCAQTIWISVDASPIPRPEAETSPDRGIIHVSNLPRAVKPISVGWQFSTVMLLPQDPSSWIGLLDQRRISTEQTAIEVAIAQLRAMVPLVQRPIIIVADRWYATAEFLRACKELACQVLIRLKRNRKLYRPRVRLHVKGRAPLDGPLFQGTRPETLTGAEAVWMSHDEKGHLVTVSRWSGLHFRQAREVPVRVFCAQRDGAKGSKRDPRESWFVCLDDHPVSVPLPQIMSSYGRRFSHEHGYRYLKQDLLWAEVHVRTPEQFERWSWCVGIVMNQLLLARTLGQACYRPWESRRQVVTPGQVRRMMPVILSQVGTPASRCQRRGNSPGRALGFHPEPTPRYDVVIKEPKKPSKPSG